MPIDRALIYKKLDFLNEQLTKVERMEFDVTELTENADIHDLIVFRLQQAVETAIDIAVHIISQLPIPRKETAKDAFLLLGQEGVIDKELSGKMGKAADFRNRVVHGYNDFDWRILFKDYRDDLADLRNFGAQIISFLDSAKSGSSR